MRILTVLSLFALAACGGSEPEPAPKAEPAKKEQPKEEKAAKQKAKGKAKGKAKADAGAKFAKMSDDEKKAYLMELGEKVYMTGEGGIACMTCHGAEGKGTPGAFPPLVGQKDHMGDCKTHAGIVINGMTGEIEVDGVKYNGVMTPQGAMLDDMKIAAVITYERLSWGNDYGACMPADVKAAR